MRRLGVLGVLALTVGSIYAQTQTTDSEYIKIVTTGEIKKVDDKNKTFQFKFNLDPPPTIRTQQQPGGRPGGVGGRRRGGLGYPGGNRTPQPQVVDNSKEVKVFTSDATSVKDGRSDLSFSDLKKGDKVTVTAIHKGKGDDIEAIAVKRD